MVTEPSHTLQVEEYIRATMMTAKVSVQLQACVLSASIWGRKEDRKAEEKMQKLGKSWEMVKVQKESGEDRGEPGPQVCAAQSTGVWQTQKTSA